MQEITWFDGTPQEALAAIGAKVYGDADADFFRMHAEWFGQKDDPSRELWAIAAIAVGNRTRVYWRPGPDLPDGTYLRGNVVPPARLAAITGWLDTAWRATAAIHVLEGPSVLDGPGFRPGQDISVAELAALDVAPPPVAAVLAVVTDPAELAAMRRDTTTGRFSGDECRCLGDVTLQLRDAAGHVLGEGHLHNHGSMVWEPDRFHNLLALPDPHAVRHRLMTWGVRGQLSDCYIRLADSMREELPGYGETVAPPPDGAAITELLDWIGSLNVPHDSLYGAGVQARRLLDAYPAGDVIAAVAAEPPPRRMLGAMNWAMHQPDDLPMARVLAPALRRLL